MTDDTQHNLAAIRVLLTDAFTAEELRRFCLDRPLFRPIVDRFSPDHGLDRMVDEVIDYCRIRLLWNELLDAVNEVNPAQYARHAARIAGEPATPPPEGYSYPLSQALLALSEMMQDPKVRKAVVAFGENFEDARHHAGELFECKYLHDKLHDLEFLCYSPISREARRFPDHDGVVEAVSYHESYLRNIADDLQEFIERPGCDMTEASWIGLVFLARDSLREATSNLDAKQLNEALRRLRRVLTTQPTRINTRLVDAAKSLRLEALVKAMQLVSDSLASLELEPERVTRFKAGVEALASLEHNLTALVAEHNQWQRLDLDLRRIEAVLELDTEELETSWPELKALSGILIHDQTERWATDFRRSIDSLDDAITAGNPSMIRQRFREFCREASDRFYRVDRALKKQCEDLSKVAGPLAAVLEMLQ